MSRLEQALLAFDARLGGNRPADLPRDEQDAAINIEQLLRDGELDKVVRRLRDKHAGGAVDEEQPAWFEEHARAQVLAGLAGGRCAQLECLMLGVACLLVFLRDNFTGPVPPPSEGSRRSCGAATAAFLTLAGEELYDRAAALQHLALARLILVTCVDAFSEVPSVCVWSARCVALHQPLLAHNVPHLHSHGEAMFDRAIALCGLDLEEHPPSSSPSSSSCSSTAQPDDSEQGVPSSGTASFLASSRRTFAVPDHAVDDWPARELAARVYMEAAYHAQCYWKRERAGLMLDKALASSGIEFELTGVLGKRTKFQKFKKAQLVAGATPGARARGLTPAAISSASAQSPEVESGGDLPGYDCVHASMENETLLSRPDLDGEEEQQQLSVVDQLVLLAVVEHIRRYEPSMDEISQEERMALLERVLLHSQRRPSSWAVQFVGLMHRAVLLLKNHHRQDTAMSQLESLVVETHGPFTHPRFTNTVSHPDGMQRVKQVMVHRLVDVCSSGMPAHWSFQKSFADTLRGMGMLNAALRMYEELCMWTPMIECMVAVGRNTEADEFIAKHIAEKGPTPLMLCLQGDIHRDESKYLEAWELSGKSYGRAQQSLANKMRREERYEEAVQHFALSLELNPSLRDEQFAHAFCLLQLERHHDASVSFARAVAIDPDYQNAWNNLAACHLHMKNYEEAYGALKEAVRLDRDNWKMWDNYMHAAVRCGQFQTAVNAMLRLADLRSPAEAVDNPILERLCSVCEDMIAEGGGVANAEAATLFYIDRFRYLLGRLSVKVTTNPVLWYCFSRLTKAVGEHKKSVQFAEKRCRALETKNWQSDPELAAQVVQGAADLVDLYLDKPTSASIYSARLKVQGLCAKLRALAEHSSEAAALVSRLEELQVAISSSSAEQQALAQAAAPSGSPATTGSAQAESQAASSSTPVRAELSDYMAMWRDE